MRLIDADALDLGNWERLHEAVRDLLDAPTIEAKPVVHGHWKLIRKGVFGVASCSNCTCDGFIEYNFCPNCGADMRGET